MFEKCSNCGTTIAFGAKKEGNLRFCGEKCRAAGTEKILAMRFAEQLPDEMVLPEVHAVHQGACPICRGVGPVDVHVSHRIWSAIHLTSWRSRFHVCCQSCGRKKRMGDAVYCIFLGWWGFPWGLIMTPVQIYRNISGIIFPADAASPSAQLNGLVRANVAERLAQEYRLKQAAGEENSGAKPI